MFLIDPLRAGAGLDGIYTAAREIAEEELFNAAKDKARKKLRGKASFIRTAQKEAERLGRRHKLTPWQIFDFFIDVDSNAPGAALGKIGLWPIAGSAILGDNQLELSAALSNRLLYVQDGRTIGDLR